MLRSRKGAPGIVAVARRAGVSPATVSRSFNHPEKVQEKTRQEIEAAASALGYIRDRTAGTLHSRFSGTVGLIVPTIDNAIFSGLAEAFSARLRDHDRNVLIAAHGYDLALEASIIRALLERRVESIVLVGQERNPVSVEMLSLRELPVLTLWNYHPQAKLPCIGADNIAAGTCSVAHLIELGHRDIAFLYPEATDNDRARERKIGALKAAAAANIQVPEARMIDCPYDLETAKLTARNLLIDNPPTAIACGNDIIAYGVLYACQALKIRVPEQLSVVGIGDFSHSGVIEPGLTTVRLPAQRIGTLAADTIVRMSETITSQSIHRQKIDFELVLRGSTKIMT